MSTTVVTHSLISLPAPSEDVSGYVDGGGTYLRVVLFRFGEKFWSETFVSADYASVNDVLKAAFCQAGAVPSKLVFALAGPIDLERGTVEMTNRPGWPIFSLSECEEDIGCHGNLVNDMEVQAADAVNTPPEFLIPIKPGHVWKDGRVVVVTCSTGLGVGICEGGHTTRTELGHGPVVGLTDLERSYCNFAATTLRKPYASIEQLVSGHHGFAMAVRWTKSLDFKPNRETRQLIKQLRDQGKDIGPAITTQVANDPFAASIVRVIGGLYGSAIRQLMATLHPAAGVHLVGGVNAGAATIFANPTYSPFLARVNDRRLPHANSVRSFAIVLNTDPSLVDRGAKALSQ